MPPQHWNASRIDNPLLEKITRLVDSPGKVRMLQIDDAFVVLAA